jgi:hypothetical protein
VGQPQLVVDVPRAPGDVIGGVRHMAVEIAVGALAQREGMGAVDVAAAEDERPVLQRRGLPQVLASQIDLAPVAGHLTHQAGQQLRRPRRENHVVFQHAVVAEALHHRVLDDPHVRLEASPRAAARLEPLRHPAPLAGHRPDPVQLLHIRDARFPDVPDKPLLPFPVAGEIDDINPFEAIREFHDPDLKTNHPTPRAVAQWQEEM